MLCKPSERSNEALKSSGLPAVASGRDGGPQECGRAVGLRGHELHSRITQSGTLLSPSNSGNAGMDPKAFKVSPVDSAKVHESGRTPPASFKRTLEESNSGPAIKKPRRGLARNNGAQPESLSSTPQRKNSSKLAMRRSLRGQKLGNPLLHQPRKALCVC